MKNLTAIAAFAAASTMAVTAAAQTEDFADQAGTLGIGINRSIADGRGAGGAGTRFFNNTGISVRYFATEALGLELVVGGSMQRLSVTPDGGDKAGNSSSQWDISLLADYRIATSRQATLNGYAGVGLAFVSVGFTGEAEEPDNFVSGFTDIAIELGLRGEVFLTRHFSIFSRVGITIDPISDTEIEFAQAENEDIKNGGMNIDIMRGGLLGAMGMTFWF